MTDAQMMIAGNLLIQGLGVAVMVGFQLRAQRDTDRRLGTLEDHDTAHESRISVLEGQRQGELVLSRR